MAGFGDSQTAIAPHPPTGGRPKDGDLWLKVTEQFLARIEADGGYLDEIEAFRSRL